MASKFKNVVELFSNTKTRTIIIFTAILLFIGLGIALTGIHRKAEESSVPAKASTVGIPDIKSVPGAAPETEQYVRAQREENIQKAQQAEKTGQSAVATLVRGPNDDTKDTSNDFSDQQNKQDKVPDMTVLPSGSDINKPQKPKPSPEDAEQQQFQSQLSQQEQAAEQQLASQNIQNIQQSSQNLAQAMTQQAKSLLSDWSAPTQQYVSGQEEETQQAAAGAATQAAATGQPAPGSQEPANPGDVVKSGAILYAELQTAVNSDEPGPILAVVEEGKYKGSKLVGSIQPLNSQYASKVVLQFNTMNIPTQTNSFKINAVAVDPGTSRTALATSVNHHYISRYGMLLGAAFLEGYGEAIADNNTIQYVNPFFGGGGTLGVISAKSTAEEIAMAMGTVGQVLGQQMANYFNRPPTIRVAAGSGIGILFLSDVDTKYSQTPKAKEEAESSAQKGAF